MSLFRRFKKVFLKYINGKMALFYLSLENHFMHILELFKQIHLLLNFIARYYFIKENKLKKTLFPCLKFKKKAVCKRDF